MVCALLMIATTMATAHSPVDQGWSILQATATSKTLGQRVSVMHVLQLLPG